MAQWKLTDYSTGSPVEYEFPINPNAFSHPGKDIDVKNEQTVATTGSVVMFMGRPKVPDLSFSGSIRTEQTYNDMVTWMHKWNPLQLTDDQGNTWTIIIKKYAPTRLRKANNQWRFNYVVEASVVE